MDNCPRCGFSFSSHTQPSSEPNPTGGSPDSTGEPVGISAPPPSAAGPIDESPPIPDSPRPVSDKSETPPIEIDYEEPGEEPALAVGNEHEGRTPQSSESNSNKKRRVRRVKRGERGARTARKPRWKRHFDHALDAIDWPADSTPSQQHESLELALQEINKAILEAPEEELPACKSTRGYIYLSLGDFDRAEDDCTAAYEHDPQDIEALVWRGCARAGRRRWLSAVEDLSLAIERGGDRAPEYTQTRERIVADALEEMRERVRFGTSDSELFYERGRIYECLGQTDRALRDFRQAIEASPDHLAARLGVAAALLELKRLDEALAEVNQVLEDPKHFLRDGLKLRARIYQVSGELNLAISDLNEVKSLDPDSVSLRVECGEIELQLGDYAGAIQDLTFAVKANRRITRPRRLRAMAYLAARNYELAIRDFDSLIHRHGNQPELLVLRGEAHWKKGDHEHADRDFRIALELDELNPRAYLGAARILAAQEKREAAHAYCDRALRLDSRLAEAHQLLGRLWFEGNQREKSIEAFSKGVRLEPEQEVLADCYYRRGIAHCQLTRFDEGLADFDRAIESRRHHAGSYVWRSSARAALGMWAEAIDDLTQAIEVNPLNASAYRKLGDDVCRRAIDHFSRELSLDDESVEAYYQRAMAREFLGENEGAHADLQRADRIAANESRVVVAWARILAGEDRQQEAIARLNLFIQDNENNAAVHSARASLLIEVGETEQALTDLVRAIEIQPSDASYRVQLADLLISNRQFERASQELTKAIALDPSSYRAFALRGRCHLMHDQYLLAIHDFSRSIEIYPDEAQTLAARGHAYVKNHQLVQALADFEAALNKSATLLDAYTGRAIVMAKRGDPESALIWLTKAMHRFEDADSWAVLLMTRGRIFFNMSRFARAIGDYTAALGLNVDSSTEAAATYARGVALFHEGDTANARADFERSLQSESRYKPARVAVEWLDGHIRQKPKALIAPKQVIRPTRPRIVAEPIEQLAEDASWESASPFDQWVIRTVDGVEFGPCPKQVIDQWVQEGRIDDATRLLRSDWERWRRASTVYVELSSEAREHVAVGSGEIGVGEQAPLVEAEDLASDNGGESLSDEDAQGDPQENPGVDYSQFESIDQLFPKIQERKGRGLKRRSSKRSDEN